MAPLETQGPLLYLESFSSRLFIYSLTLNSSSPPPPPHTHLLVPSVWLLNPVNAIVSARGNAESLLSTVILGVVYFLSLKQLVLAAFLFGFAVHFKIYPIIYALPLYLVLDGDYDGYED